MVAHKLIAIHPAFSSEFKGESGKQLRCEGEGDGRSPATRIAPDNYTRVAGEGRVAVPGLLGSSRAADALRRWPRSASQRGGRVGQAEVIHSPPGAF